MRKILFAAILTLASLFTVTPATGSIEQRDGHPETTKCCADLVAEIKSATNDPLLPETDIFVEIDRSPAGKNEIGIGLFPGPPASGEKPAFYTIVVYEKLLRTFDNDELFGVLAHEIKHVCQRLNRQWSDRKLANEYLADEFAANLLVKHGRRKNAIITALLKIQKDPHSNTQETLKEIPLRIRNLEKLLDSLEKPPSN